MSEKLQEVINLTMSPQEANLVCWCLANGIAIANGDIANQYKTATNIVSLLHSMGREQFESFTSRVMKLSEVTKSALEDTDTGCRHCDCRDSVCCWCGGIKEL